MYCKYILSFTSHFSFLPQGGHAVAYQSGGRWGGPEARPGEEQYLLTNVI